VYTTYKVSTGVSPDRSPYRPFKASSVSLQLPELTRPFKHTTEAAAGAALGFAVWMGSSIDRTASAAAGTVFGSTRAHV
jgi:hypothetical protein